MLMFTNKNDIKTWLDSIGVENYTINDDLNVDVNGNVDLSYRNLVYIPVYFNIVNGGFDCSFNKLTSLKGCPKEVNKWFNCSFNKLQSLEYSPEIVDGSYHCFYNQLTSLRYLPSNVIELFCDEYLFYTKEYKEYQNRNKNNN